MKPLPFKEREIEIVEWEGDAQEGYLITEAYWVDTEENLTFQELEELERVQRDLIYDQCLNASY